MIKNICQDAILRGGKLKPLILPFDVTEGLGLTNPSILKVGDNLMINIRHVQYALYHSEKDQKFQSPYGSLVYLNPEDDVTLTTKNFICELNENSLEIKNFSQVDTSKFDKKPLWEFVGLEDARLVNWNDKKYLTGVRRDTTTNGQGRMELSTLKYDNSNKISESDRIRIKSTDKNSYCEKNWMPIADMPYHYVKWTCPTEIVKFDPIKKTTTQVKLVEQDYSFPRDLRGGSQVIKYKDFFVCLTHEVDLWKDEQGRKDAQYYHRFIVWDKDWKIVYHSDQFKFADARIEFSCGMHFSEKELLITFGYQDTTAFILTLPLDYFEELVGIKEASKTNDFNVKQDLFSKFAFSPETSSTNYNLALFYYSHKQWASSLSFFLRVAEIEKDRDKIYESLLFVAKCLGNLGRRKTTELSLWNNAVRFAPNRPEAYLFLSQFYEAMGKFSEAQAFARIGLEFKENHSPINPLLGYNHFYQFLFQDAVCDWNLGQGASSRKKFLELKNSLYPLNDLYKNLVQTNLTSLGSSADPFLPYDVSMADKLRYKFKGYKNIEKNFSQTFQDMFVLSMLDGKTKGTYLEIGAADPFHGSNTALLEQLGWKGTSLEILPHEVEKFKAHRKNEVILCDATKVDYKKLITSNYVDYLQVDCEPPSTTFEILKMLPFDSVDFGVITYEHDHYTDVKGVYRELSRKYLTERGYVLVVGNIAPDNISAYEDWYVHPKYIKEKTLRLMLDESDKVQKASDYMTRPKYF